MINASPFGMGLLNGRDPADWHPADEAERAVFRRAAEFCEEQGVPIAKLALQFSASHPDMPTTMFGSASADSVERNIKWIEEPYEGELIEAVREILAPVMDKQWDFDAGVDRLKKSGQ
jgi:aryl-alcohol dehydrogenase-like predicted oxidoreductase